MARTNTMPLTAWDLREIADATDSLEKMFSENSHLISNVRRVEISRPDCEDRIGWVERFDPSDISGWGFVMDDENG